MGAEPCSSAPLGRARCPRRVGLSRTPRPPPPRRVGLGFTRPPPPRRVGLGWTHPPPPRRVGLGCTCPPPPRRVGLGCNPPPPPRVGFGLHPSTPSSCWVSCYVWAAPLLPLRAGLGHSPPLRVGLGCTRPRRSSRIHRLVPRSLLGCGCLR